MDSDGDGYGVDCEMGPDCNDDAPGIKGECQANGCPQGWKLVPDTDDFQMGCNSGDPEITCNGANDLPMHQVTLSSYCIQETEVSVRQYRECKEQGICTGTPAPTGFDSSTFYNWSQAAADREEHPINGIDWSDSREYCQKWMGGDLPTEAQWEKAARGGDQRTYPWGRTPEPDCTLCNFDVNGALDEDYGCSSVTEGPVTWPVGHLAGGEGDSPYGLKDLAGNVYEWVLDCYDESFYSSCVQGCTDPVSNPNGCTSTRVSRGGSFESGDPRSLRVFYRSDIDPSLRLSTIGFRCARSP